MQDNSEDPSLSLAQSIKYAEDIAIAYKDEHNRRMELETASEKISIILDSMSEGILAIDRDLLIIHANKYFCKLFNVELSAIQGMNCNLVLNISELKEILIQIINDSINSSELRMINSDSGEKILNLKSVKLKKNKGYIITFQDITARRRNENAKNEFLSILSHELKTPLNGIIGFASMLKEDFDSVSVEDRVSFLSMVLESAERMERIVGELLNFASLQWESRDILNEKVVLSKALDDAIFSLKDNIEQSEVKITVQKPIINQTIIGNHRIIKEFFYHILGNAIIYGRQKGHISINFEEKTEEIYISIIDDGIGIPATDLTKVFDSFYQVEEYITRNRK
ncbi:MAG: PAS-domain containing protein, partial [Spirochaetales bacterium]|nr:PAS-domain containing protein [Spirochaetales bacterium]